MTEQQPQPSTHETTTEEDQEQLRTKTLAVRLDEQTHAQLRFIAQLGGTSIAEEIRRAIEIRIATAQDDPELVERASRVQQAIEREAETRRAAIAEFLGKPAVTAAVDVPKPTPRAGSRSPDKTSTGK